MGVDFMIKNNFQSDRLRYSFPCLKDAVDIKNNITENITKNLLVAPWPYKLKDAENFISSCSENRKNNLCLDYVIRKKEDSQFVRICSLHIAKYAASKEPGQLGYWITEKQQKHGYGLEAAKDLLQIAKDIELKNIWASTLKSNSDSINLLIKLGMQFVKEDTFFHENKELKRVFYEIDF